MSADLVDRLRSIANAYPTDIFPELSDDERKALQTLLPGYIDRISAGMGRHFSQVFLEAANALELKRGEAPRCPTCDCEVGP